jgi:hypothetical protein
MRKSCIHIALIFVLLLVSACQVNPRYRSGGEKTGSEEKAIDKDYRFNYKKNNSNLSTKEFIRFGRIIESFLGKPYRDRTESGQILDCSQLTRQIFSRFNGTKLPRMARDQYKEGVAVSRQKMQFGDLVFFRTDGRSISHVGIYINNDEFVHASSSNGVIISSIREKYWKKRFVGCRRILQ